MYEGLLSLREGASIGRLALEGMCTPATSHYQNADISERQMRLLVSLRIDLFAMRSKGRLLETWPQEAW